MNKTNVVMVKTGSEKDFPITYVTRLVSMIRRHTTADLKFTLLTDKPNRSTTGIDEVVDISSFNLHGYYNKMTLFNKDVIPADERVVFFDLDTVILKNIDEIFDYDGDFAILSNFSRPMGINKCKYGSAIMSIGPGEWRHELWNEFGKNRDYYLNVSKKIGLGDQYIIELIYDNIINTSGAELWQNITKEKSKNYFRSFKFPRRLDNGPPDDCHVVCYHGKPKCLEMQHLKWMKEHWR